MILILTILSLFQRSIADKEGVILMETIKIVIDDKFGADRSLKKFKRMVETYGVVREYRKRQEFKKPSVRAKEKSEAAEKRRRKLNGRFGQRRSKI